MLHYFLFVVILGIMNSKIIIALGAGVVLFVLVFALMPKREEERNLDTFAQCLSERGFTMYGAAWCSHCKSEKLAFGESFKFVSYVDCIEEVQKCTEVGINGYPTWIGADGVRYEGVQGIVKLSALSGCVLE